MRILHNFFAIKNIWRTTALLLILAIGLHGVVHHEHPKSMGEGIQAAFHGENKKWLIIALAMINFLFGASVVPTFFLNTKSEEAFSLNRNIKAEIKMGDFLLLAFRQGILNPKLH